MTMATQQAQEKRSSRSLWGGDGKKVQRLLSQRKVIKDPTEYLVSKVTVTLIVKYKCLNLSLYPADIIFEVKDKPHPRFHREGIDMIYKPTITLLMVSCIYSCNSNAINALDWGSVGLQ